MTLRSGRDDPRPRVSNACAVSTWAYDRRTCVATTPERGQLEMRHTCRSSAQAVKGGDQLTTCENIWCDAAQE